jgi:hypothetical protein
MGKKGRRYAKQGVAEFKTSGTYDDITLVSGEIGER